MTQTFGIHIVNGLPYSDSNLVYNLNKMETRFRSSIYVASDPVGAKIFIDGIEQNGLNTPAMINDIYSGYHTLRLTSPGYIDIESGIPLESGKTYNIFLTMGKSNSSLPTDSSGLIILFTIGLIGFLLIRKYK